MLTPEDDRRMSEPERRLPEPAYALNGLPGLGDHLLQALLVEIAAGKRRLVLDVAPGHQVVLIGADALATLDPDGQPTAAPVPVSPREMAVLQGIMRGQTAAAIGAALGISRSTVNHHLLAARRKLGAHTSLEAVDAARRRGLLE
jgi:DNA-binding CsgD family transcriptional regulator